jgi:hypothetical protein
MMVGSLAVSGYGAYKGQEAENQANLYNAQMSERQAAMADLQARDARIRGKQEEAAFRQNLEEVKGQQRAGFAASGVVVDKGSSQDVLLDTAAQGELDALTIRRNAKMESWMASQTAGNYLEQSKMQRSMIANPWKAAGMSLLTQGGQMGAQYGMAKAAR